MIATSNTVLVIDDDSNLRALLRILLEFEGYQVLLAPDGEVGLELAKSEQPDCILLDVIMPYRDGMDVYLDLQNTPQTSGIPIIVLSGSVNRRDEETWRGLPHVVDVMRKPFDVKMLAQRLSEIRLSLFEGLGVKG